MAVWLIYWNNTLQVVSPNYQCSHSFWSINPARTSCLSLQYNKKYISKSIVTFRLGQETPQGLFWIEQQTHRTSCSKSPRLQIHCVSRTVGVDMSNLPICRPDLEVFMRYTCLTDHFVDKSTGISILPLFNKLRAASSFVCVVCKRQFNWAVCEWTKGDQCF